MSIREDELIEDLNMEIKQLHEACSRSADEIERLRSILRRLIVGDIGRATLLTLSTGQATNTDDGKSWMKAAEIVNQFD